ncbi:MAG: RluA family pseudouridine synthase [Granulosicoccus sp.]
MNSSNPPEPIPDLPVLFEDDHVILVNKPSGMLSQPGKQVSDSVLTRVLEHRPQIHGTALVHRLDMDTSGIMVLAKSRSSQRSLQRQLEQRTVRKRYVAQLENPLSALGGSVNLPLRVDLENRPHQIVCKEHGKPGSTLWRSALAVDRRRIVLYPVTGRTHQLRVHMAHAQGLNNPIAGDRLYGTMTGNRLLLHAEFLSFAHPASGQLISFECMARF